MALFTPSTPSIFTEGGYTYFTDQSLQAKSSDPFPLPYLYIVKIKKIHPILTLPLGLLCI